MSARRGEHGQATVMLVICLVVLLGMAALVLDVGTWFQAQRQTQAAADAAALAAAQALPSDAIRASALAEEYLGKNGDGDMRVRFSADVLVNDTVRVEVERDAPAFFARVFGVQSVDVNGNAAARAFGFDRARYMAPIVVHLGHPELNCGLAEGRPVPCFGEPTEIRLHHLHQPGSDDAAGSFGLINLVPGASGSASPEQLGGWIESGYDDYLPLGQYRSTVSSRFNSTQVRDALQARLHDILLFPVYSTITGPGNNAMYTIVAWVGFRLTDFRVSGPGTLYGHFTEVVWEGIAVDSRGGPTNYGARAIELVE